MNNKLQDANNSLSELAAKADAANHAKSDFLAKMSHEIRTPINAVIGMNEMILREGKETEIHKYAFDIKRSANTLLSIINEILDSSKIESGKLEIIPVAYDISSLFYDIHNMINLRAQNKGLKLIFDIDKNMPAGLFGDDIRLRQVVVNLLTNAVKYTHEGKAHINSISTSQFIILNTPVDKDTILDRICKALNVTCIDNIIVDNKAGKKSILLVDDSKIQLRALNEMLKEKYEVRVATSGMQALTLIGKKKPDLIFLDYEMPICDGKMTLEMIRELDESKDIPVVFLTGVSDKEHIAAVLDLKPEGYLLKTANSDGIYKTIEKVFGEINNDI